MLEKISPTHYRIHGSLGMQEGSEDLVKLLESITDKKSALDQVNLDFSSLESADSVLLAWIINIARAVEAKNGILRITGFPEHLRSLAKTYGVDVLIEHYMIFESMHGQ